MKILSIDFDYFQSVSPEFIKSNYPDGYDIEGVLGDIIWASHYGPEICENEEDKIIKNVSINKKELLLAKDIVKANAGTTLDTMITSSHRDIYNYIFDRIKGNKNLSIVNVDMHHDMFNDNKETVDCGNWLGKVVDRHKNTSIRWVVNPISEEVYGLGANFDNLLIHSLEEIKNEKFDHIFLCRSDVWLPPHLDCYFNELKDCITENCKGSVYYNKSLDRNRMESVVAQKQAEIDMLSQIER